MCVLKRFLFNSTVVKPLTSVLDRALSALPITVHATLPAARRQVQSLSPFQKIYNQSDRARKIMLRVPQSEKTVMPD